MVNGTSVPTPRSADPAGTSGYSRRLPGWPGWPSRRDRVDAWDVALAAVSFAAFTLPGAAGVAVGSGPAAYGSTTHVVLFGALAVTPLVVRRRWPVAALVGVTAVECAASLLGVRFTPFVSNAGPVLALAVFVVADRCPRRRSLFWCAAAAIATAVAAAVAIPLHPDQDQNVVQVLMAAPAWLLGDTLRVRRDYRRRLAWESRREAAERERRIRAEERLRVSRDVHDVVSHTLSMIAVRSGVARLLLDEQPEQARDALIAIETTSRSALDEVRRVLRQTRHGTGPAAPNQANPASGPSSGAERDGGPTLRDLEPMVTGLRHDGLRVSYRGSGQARDYLPVLETSAYRIVQEALTNVVKHSGATRAQVEVHHEPRELVVSVVDDGRVHQPQGHRSHSQGGGLGLIGMRERAELFGGTLTAGPRDEGGFAVVARFPADHPVTREPADDAADQV
ncbi:sensor histidine kinase [Frankia sp. Ag45/Mut15]|uniref:histidine kinase n=1 Tax=Frankia umida TaxID=573489 RepID=A0ABT0JV98_9ACTN|nr:sensor histidine kinase [Frankia umida]MCK9875477.1 sensor histidine kinase [Frankia umida]